MIKNTITYSALRASEHKTDDSFYQELSLKTLLTIGLLVEHDTEKSISISQLKLYMGINFAALAKIINRLKVENSIVLSIKNKNNEADKISPDELFINLTKDGLNMILKTINNQSISFNG